MLRPKKISEKYLVKTPWLTLREDKYSSLKKEENNKYYIVERSNFVVIVPYTAQKEFILVRQYRYGVEKFVFNFPMGFINNGETPKKAAVRELGEEVGFSSKRIKKMGSFSLAPSFTKARANVWLAENLSEIKSSRREKDDDEKIANLKFVSRKQLEGMINNGKLNDLSSVLAYFLAKKAVRK